MNQRTKQWLQTLSGELREEHLRKHRALKDKLQPPTTDPRRSGRFLFDALVEAFGEQCAECGSTTNLQVDHIKPHSLGGRTVFNNLQLLCGTCNSKKSNRATHLLEN
jgi:5-methylcytosine-specific restriction endonuclease McrA